MASLKKKPTKQGYVVEVKISFLDFKSSLQTFTTKVTEARKAKTKIEANELRIKSREVDFETAEYAGMSRKERDRSIIHFLMTGQEREAVLADAPMTVREGIEYFLEEQKRRGRKHQTVVGYRGKLEAVCKHFERKHKGVTYHQITRKMVQDMAFKFCDERASAGMTKGQYLDHKTISSRVTLFSSVFRLLIVESKIDVTHGDLHTLFDDIQLKEHASKYDVLYTRDYQTLAERRVSIVKEGLDLDDRLCYQNLYLSDDEIDRYFRVMDEQLLLPKFAGLRYRRVRVAALFASYTGLRRSEIVRIRRRDLDLEARSVRAIKYKGKAKSKTHFEHYQTLPVPLVQILEDWLPHVPEDQQAVFTSNDLHLDGDLFDDNQNKTKSNEAGQLLRSLMKGTDFELCSGWHLHRHNFASLLVANGATAEEGRSIIGHKSTEMFNRYGHKSRQQRDSFVDKIGNITSGHEVRTKSV